MFGTEPTFPIDLIIPNNLLPNEVHSIKEMDHFRKIAVDNIKKAQQKTKDIFDKTHIAVTYPVNSLVLLKIPQYKPGISKKLANKYHGPYKIVTQISPVVYKVMDIAHPEKPLKTINVRLIRPYYIRPSTIPVTANKYQPVKHKPKRHKVIPVTNETPSNSDSDDEIPLINNNDIEVENKQDEYKTRSGRVIKKPQRY
jgi:hypothetical protein